MRVTANPQTPYAQRVAQKKPREGAGLKLSMRAAEPWRKRGNPHRDNTTAGCTAQGRTRAG